MTFLQRKKLAFMSVVNKVKGFVRSVSGIPPLTLPDCVDEDSLIDYSMSGNSAQNGTPTPEASVEVESVGEYDEASGKYKIPVVCRGKNMFDRRKSSNEGIREETSRTYWFNPVLNKAGFAELLDGIGTYSISYDIEFVEVPDNYGGCDSRYGIAIMNSSGTSAILQPKWNYRNVGYKERIKSKFTILEEHINNPTLSLYAYSNAYYATEDKTTAKLVYGKVIISNIQIEKSSEATDYEPYIEPVTTNIYLDEPLRKIGDYADCVDFENGIVRKTIYEKVLTEDNSWTQWDTSITNKTSGVYYRSTNDLGTYSNQKIVAVVGLSNYFTATPQGLNTQKDEYVGRCVFSGASNPPYIGFKVPFVTLDEWKQWLAEKNAEGNPLKVYWVLKNPQETTVVLPKLPTFKGTTVYTVGTDIQPSDMSATYYSTSKE